MRAALKYLESRHLIDPFELHPVRLSGEDTLHIDYVTNYAGEGEQRRMPLYEPGIANPAAINELMRTLGVSDAAGHPDQLRRDVGGRWQHREHQPHGVGDRQQRGRNA